MPKVILLGYGSIGQRHAQSLAALGVAPEDAVAADPLLRESQPGGPRTYQDPHEALERWGAGATVVIASPTRFHAEHAIAAVRAGAAAIYLEKPPAVTLEEWIPAAEAVALSGVTFACGFNWRFHPLAEFWREAIQVTSRVVFLSVDDMLDWPTAHQPGSYIFRKDEGGALLTSAVHTIDLAIHLMGPVETVRCLAPMGTGEFAEVDMDVLVELRHRGGRSSVIGAHWNIGAPSVSCMKADDEGHIFMTDSYARDFHNDNNLMHFAAMKAFMEYAAGGDPGHLCLLDDATEVMRVIDACQRSNLASEVRL